ncbi:hypothetical protein N9242_05610 [Vicingaceae bacterium]|nr:hypothetical protein [Vicingaceae bacterium]
MRDFRPRDVASINPIALLLHWLRTDRCIVPAHSAEHLPQFAKSSQQNKTLPKPKVLPMRHSLRVCLYRDNWNSRNRNQYYDIPYELVSRVGARRIETIIRLIDSTDNSTAVDYHSTNSIRNEIMDVRFTQLGIILAFSVFLIVSIPCDLLSQDRYRSLYEELSLLEPVSPTLFLQEPAPSATSQSATSSQAVASENQSSSTTDQVSARPQKATKSTKPHGDFMMTHQFAFQNWAYNTSGNVEYIVPGRLRIGDNNSAETDNRFIFRQNYFKNAIDSKLTNAAGRSYCRNDDLNQFVVGFEKTLGCSECWSIEMRLPLFGSSDVFFNDGFSTQNASTGNLALIGKRVLFQNNCRIVSAGLGVSVPTGDDASFIAGDELFTVKNRATHIAPFLATLWEPNEKWFFHGFLTVDVAASSNPVEYRQLMPAGNAGLFGEFTNQSLLNVDLAAGYWWFRDRECCTVTALSSIIEVHYVTTISEADMVYGNTATNYVQFTNPLRSFDSFNATAGFDMELLNRLNLRSAVVVPFGDNDNRFFDAEFQSSINFRF